MKLRISSLLIALTLLMTPVVASAAAPMEGRWHTPNREGTVEVQVKDGVLSGKLVDSSNSKAKLGTVILRDFSRSDGKWVGKIYVPKKGKTLDAQLSLSDGKLVIKVKAGLRTKSVVWTRAKG